MFDPCACGIAPVPSSSNAMKTRRIIFVAVVVTALVFALRFYQLGQQREQARARIASDLAQAVPIPTHQPPPYDGKPRRELPAFTAHTEVPPLPDQPSDQEIAGSRLFPIQLWPIDRNSTGGGDSAGNAAVAALMRKLRGLGGDERYAEIERWLAANPDSRWHSSLKFQLMVHRHERGFFGTARQGWDELWTMLKDRPDKNALFLGNEVLARLLDSNMGLARSKRLRELVADAEGRLINGPVEARLLRAKEAVWLLEHTGAQNIMCGPLALNSIKDHLGQPFDPPRLGKVSADYIATGIPMSAVATYATDHYKLDLRMAKRTAGSAPIPTPAVVHLKDEHYVALLGRNPDNGDYFLEDRTQEFAGWVEPASIDEMSSGYFLVPASMLKGEDGWQEVTAEEGRNVFGRDGGHGMEPPGENVTDDSEKAGDEEEKKDCVTGMPSYVFHPMPGAVRVSDVPVGYSPPVGRGIFFKINYNDLDSGAPVSAPPFSNVGITWSTDWVSWIDHPGNFPFFTSLPVTVHLMGGGVETSTYNAVEQRFGPNDRSFATIVRSGTSTYLRGLPDGSQELYDTPDDPAYPSRVFLTRLIDPQGNTTSFSYDSNMRLVGVTDAIGQVTTIQYTHPTDIYKITSVTDPFGRHASLQYNVAGQLTGVTDVLNLSSTFTYDASGFIATMTTPYGTTIFRKIQESSGSLRVLEVQDPMGDVERVQYIDTGGSVIIPSTFAPPPAVNVAGKLVDFHAENERMQFRNSFYWSRKAWAAAPNDFTAARTYRWYTDKDWKVTGIMEAVKEAREDRVWFNYPGAAGANESALGLAAYPGKGGQPEKTLRMLADGTPQLTQTYYNEMGNLTRSVDPLGRTTEYIYRTNGIDLISIRQITPTGQDVLGRFVYDAKHRPLQTVDAAGEATVFTYNSRGQVLTVTNALGETITYGYNANGYLLTIDGPLAGSSDTVTHTYDSFGRIQSITGVDGYTLSFTYDALDRLLRTTFPDGTYQENTYDKLELASTKDRLQRVTSYTYNSRRQRTSVTDPLNRTINFAWCKCGSLARLTDPMGRITRWLYDIQGRLVEKVYADESVVEYEYEPGTNRLRRKIDEKGQSTIYEYTIDDQLKSISYPDALIATPSVSYTYDATYKRVTSMSDGIGLTSYSYVPNAPGASGAGQLSSIDGPLSADTLSYTYDKIGRRRGYTVNGVGESVTLDPAGRMTQAVNPLGAFVYAYIGSTTRLASLAYPGGLGATYGYHPVNGNSRLSEIVHTLPAGGQLSRHQYSYNQVGNITRWTQVDPSANLNRSWLIGYDGANQLATIATQDPITSLDLPNGAFSYTYDPVGNRITESAGGITTTANYDSLNRLISQSGGAALPELTYEWNGNGRLATVIGGGRRDEFSYDGLGRLCSVVEKMGGNFVRKRNFLWNEFRLVEERDGTGSAVIKRYFSHGMQWNPGGGGEQAFLFTRDHLGTVRDVILPTGALRASFDYDPWGRRTMVSGTDDAELSFTGHLWHSASGLSLAPFRPYASWQGRWVSRDLIAERDGFNMYQYVKNNPIRFFDRTGMAGEDGNGFGVDNGLAQLITMGNGPCCGSGYDCSNPKNPRRDLDTPQNRACIKHDEDLTASGLPFWHPNSAGINLRLGAESDYPLMQCFFTGMGQAQNNTLELMRTVERIESGDINLLYRIFGY